MMTVSKSPHEREGARTMEFSIARTVQILQRTPGVLRAMISGADSCWVDEPYGPGTWSAREVVAHLVFAERTDWLPRARWILREGDRTPLPAFDRAGHRDLLRHSAGELLDLFEHERAAGLAELQALGLTTADLERRGTHPALGTVTLANLLSTWAVHDLNHVAQVAKAMAWQYRAQVGPWEAYLSILSPPNPR